MKDIEARVIIPRTNENDKLFDKLMNKMDETAKSLLLEAYAKEIEKKTAEINALKEGL